MWCIPLGYPIECLEIDSSPGFTISVSCDHHPLAPGDRGAHIAANTTDCSHCGGSHPPNRQASCPALGTTCSNCGIPHHYAKACRKPPRRGKRQHQQGRHSPDRETPTVRTSSHAVRDDSASLHHAFASAVTETNHNYGVLDHHVFQQNSKSWIKRTSKTQPFITVSVSTHKHRAIHRFLS